MIIQEHDKLRITRICNHEAGHYIASRELNFLTGGIHVNIKSLREHAGSAIIQPWTPNITTIDETITYLERRIKVLYAGVISEATDRGGRYNSDYALKEWESGGGRDDNTKIKELLQTMRNLKYPDATESNEIQKGLDSIAEGLFDSAHTIIKDRLALIQGVSENIFNKIKQYSKQYILTEKEINDIPRIKELYLN